MNEVLNAMRIVKMYCWEAVFEECISEARRSVFLGFYFGLSMSCSSTFGGKAVLSNCSHGLFILFIILQILFELFISANIFVGLSFLFYMLFGGLCKLLQVFSRLGAIHL